MFPLPAVDIDLIILIRVIILTIRSLVPNGFFNPVQRFKSISGKINRIAFYFSRLEDVPSEWPKIAFYLLSVTTVVFQSATPQALVVLYAVADLTAD